MQKREKGETMGYWLNKIKELEDEKSKLEQEKEHWKREAIRLAAELEEIKIKIAQEAMKVGVHIGK
ncbi:MAG: hypothetical protein K0R92_543 [Lachnospiraceae bacterium]|jgi:ribosomal protein L9|nr:hypothetical protein [Lachnospiraceae bacterium]